MHKVFTVEKSNELWVKAQLNYSSGTAQIRWKAGLMPGIISMLWATLSAF